MFDFISWSLAFVEQFGYLGVFISSVIGSATVIFPVPHFALVFTLSSVLNPFMVAFVSSIGAAIGELTGYGVGYGGGKIAEKNQKYLIRAKKWMKNHNFFTIVVVFSATPLPMDVIGILAGALKYDLKKFLLATWLGRFLMYITLAYSGFHSIAWLTGQYL